MMKTDPATTVLTITVGVVALFALISLTVGLAVFMKRENKNVMQGINERMTTLKSMMAQSTAEDEIRSLGQIWLTKHQENTNYFLIITRQLKLTFALALASAIFGLVLFAITICTALIFQEKLVVAIVPAVSAAIVELFSGIVLTVHRATLKQVSHFSDISNRDERLYSALLFANTVSPQNRDKVIETLLQNETANLAGDPPEEYKSDS